jgi:hypothetical protein
MQGSRRHDAIHAQHASGIRNLPTPPGSTQHAVPHRAKVFTPAARPQSERQCEEILKLNTIIATLETAKPAPSPAASSAAGKGQKGSAAADAAELAELRRQHMESVR